MMNYSNLDGNWISEIRLGDVAMYDNLTSLSLKRNRITMLSDGSFRGLTKLKRLLVC